MGRSGSRLTAVLSIGLAAFGCGGQSGAEGSAGPDILVPPRGMQWPGPGASCDPLEEEPGFDPWVIEERVVGRQKSTLRWTALGFPDAEPGTAQPVSIDI
jgi:hypothetical protein